VQMRTIRSSPVVLGKRRPMRWAPQHDAMLDVIRLDKRFTLGYCPRVGWYPITSTSCRPPYEVISKFAPVEAVLVKRKSTLPATPEGKVQHLAAMETKMWHGMPNILAHIAVVKYDDGGVRLPGMMMIKTLGASWVVVLKDQDAGLQMQCLGNTLDDALALAELQLGSDEAPWEHDPWAKRQTAGKGQKK